MEVNDYLNNNESLSEEEKTYINNKYYFWMLKLTNQNFSSINEIKDTILVEKEVRESINNLITYINNIDDVIYDNKKQNEQLFIIKILYELGLYFYFKNEEKNSYKFLNSLINYYNKYIQKYSADINNDENKIFYFDIQDVKALVDYYENKKNKNKEGNMVIERNENIINNINIFNDEDIINCENIVIGDFDQYKKEINKAEEDYKNLCQKSNSDSLSEIDYNNKNCINVLLSCLKISEFLTYKSSEDYTYYKTAYDYINTLQNKLDNKIKSNTNRKEDADLQYVKKEIVYLINLLDLIDKVNNKKEKLDKSFLNNLANYIIANTLTGNLRLSGMIHSYIINFSQNIKRNGSYFSNFVEFFADKTQVYKDETIKQIVFLDKIVKIFHEINDAKNKVSFPLDKDKEVIVNFEENFHIELLKIFIYWLSPDDESKPNQKNNLKYLPSINILFIIIESLKNLEFLKILKIIYSIILKFLINFKNLNHLEFNSDLLEAVYETKPKLLKVNNLFDDIIKGFVVLVDDVSYNINIKMNFKEIKNMNELNIKKENINFYINILFNIVQNIEKKIKKIEHNPQSKNHLDENFSEIINYKKYQFLFSFFYSKEIIAVNKKNIELKKAIVNSINYFTYLINNYKICFMKLDLMNDNVKIKKNYEAFKSLIDQDILYQLILCFCEEKKFLESIILIQYSKKFDKNIAFILLKNLCEQNDSINLDNFKFIWKMPLFEYLANFYSKMNNNEAINKINVLIKRISNHQFFKGHQIRKKFKILNFFNFLDYLNNIKYNI